MALQRLPAFFVLSQFGKGIAEISSSAGRKKKRSFWEVFSDDDLTGGQGRGARSTHIADDELVWESRLFVESVKKRTQRGGHSPCDDDCCNSPLIGGARAHH